MISPAFNVYKVAVNVVGLRYLKYLRSVCSVFPCGRLGPTMRKVAMLKSRRVMLAILVTTRYSTGGERLQSGY